MQEKQSRFQSLDALRGLIIILMALDHANNFIADGKKDPEMWAFLFPDYQGNAVAFLTRFVTHLAAPGFFFLMGVGMVFFERSRRGRGWSPLKIAGHFIVRGLLLIVFQFTLENAAWNISGGRSGQIYFGVLFALGSSMILSVLFLKMDMRWVAVLGMGLIVFTEILLLEAPVAILPYPAWQVVLLQSGLSSGIWVLYPVLPWLGVVGLGMFFGDRIKWKGELVLMGGLKVGVAALLLFAAIRLGNGFGNIRPMMFDDGWISFFNLVKYPPSLTFLLFTLGVNLILLGLFERYTQKLKLLLAALAVYGRVPFFFYILHLYIYGYMGILSGEKSIPGMYPYWLLGLGILFPLCVAYGRIKQSRGPDSLLRFL